MYQKYIFENFKTKIFLDDSCILLVIPDYKSSPLCGHVAMIWFRRRNVFCFSQEFSEKARNLSEIYFWKFQDKNIPEWFLVITGDSWPQIQSAMRTCGHEMVSQAKRFCLSLQLPGTEGAARVEPSLLKLCRVASEEDEVNSQEFIRNSFFCFV